MVTTMTFLSPAIRRMSAGSLAGVRHVVG